ncbi:MAG: phosphate ABC transporter substrate-binding protein [Gammaproteobacteria bacterium]|nr:phosphate ABC transporter substrate-binding protein [Gammaproteobacteria bacterium]
MSNKLSCFSISLCILLNVISLSNLRAEEVIDQSSLNASSKVNLQQKDLVHIHGSNTVGEEFAPLLIETFLKSRNFDLVDKVSQSSPVEKKIIGTDLDSKTKLIFDLQAHGSSTGFADLISKKAHIAMASRKIKPEEKLELGKIYPSFLNDNAEHIIAYDALAIVVHPKNPISNLSLTQIAQLFSGQVKDWSEISEYSGSVNLYSRDDNSGTYDTFNSLVLKANGMKLSSFAGRYESSHTLVQNVTSDPYGIGFVGVSHIGNGKVIAVTRKEGVTGIKPNKFTIGTEDYPLSRKLFLYYPTELAHSEASAFVAFVKQERGQRLADDAGLVSFFPTSDRPALDSNELERQYANLAMFGRRLSVVLRLPDNQLDAKTKRDIQRIAQFKQQYPHNRLVLAGFSDDPDQKTSSKLQVETWLEHIKRELENLDIEPWSVDAGFLPLEKSANAQKDELNRRVEVWVL